jgi:hypothetical protein
VHGTFEITFWYELALAVKDSLALQMELRPVSETFKSGEAPQRSP